MKSINRIGEFIKKMIVIVMVLMLILIELIKKSRRFTGAVTHYSCIITSYSICMAIESALKMSFCYNFYRADGHKLYNIYQQSSALLKIKIG